MKIALATIAFDQPRLIEEQQRLLEEFLEDDFELIVVENEGRLHHEGLNAAALYLQAYDVPYIGFLDHDVFPIRPTTLIDKISESGFYGVGQRHPATGHLYLWPGFCFFSRAWLAGRPLDFTGLRDGDKRNDGDTGSGLWPLFEGEDWEKMYRLTQSYGVIREPDGYGLQSWGYEKLGEDWIHFSNGSKWMRVPDPEGREELLFNLLAEL